MAPRKKIIQKSKKNIVIIGVTTAVMVASSMALIQIPNIRQLLADVVVTIDAIVPINIAYSTPITPEASNNCRTLNWSNIIPINDAGNAFLNAEYKVNISRSPVFNALDEESSYATGLAYQVQNSLSEGTAYYFRTRARDPLRPSEESNYSNTTSCTTSISQNNTPSGSSGGGYSNTILPPGDSADAPTWIKKTFIQPMIGKEAIDLTVTTTDQKQKKIPIENMKKTGLKPVKKDRVTIIELTNKEKFPEIDKKYLDASKYDSLSFKPASINMDGIKNMPNPENVVVACFDEATQTWFKIPTYYNPAKNTYRFRASTMAVYALATVEDIQEKFQDIHRYDWFYDYAENMRLLDIAPKSTELSGNFDPLKPITPIEAQKMVARAFSDSLVKNTPLISTDLLTRGDAIGMIMEKADFSPKAISMNIIKTPFKDVSRTNKNYEYILKAYQLSTIRGYNDDTFRPEAPINRAEFAKILVKTMENHYLLDVIKYSPNLQSIIEKELSLSKRKYVGTKTISAKNIIDKMVTLSKKEKE